MMSVRPPRLRPRAPEAAIALGLTSDSGWRVRSGAEPPSVRAARGLQKGSRAYGRSIWCDTGRALS
eukprot:972115-Prymnesium_polylepis.2